jgi:hypothetical protein
LQVQEAAAASGREGFGRAINSLQQAASGHALLMRALIALQLLCCASAFYVPLLAPQSYKADEEVGLHSNAAHHTLKCGKLFALCH